MQSLTEILFLESTEITDIIDITNSVKKKLSKSKIKNGIVNIFTKHTTTSIRINENEKGLISDIKCYFNKLVPISGQYCHDEIDDRKDTPIDEPENAHSHIKQLMMGTSETIPFQNNNMMLGTWQRILFIDFDGPRKREVVIQIIGE